MTDFIFQLKLSTKVTRSAQKKVGKHLKVWEEKDEAKKEAAKRRKSLLDPTTKAIESADRVGDSKQTAMLVEELGKNPELLKSLQLEAKRITDDKCREPSTGSLTKSWTGTRRATS